MRIGRLFPLMLCVVPLVTGCDTTDSGDIRTSGLFVIYHVEQDGDRASLRAEFRVDNFLGNLVRLSDGDEVSVNGTILTYQALIIPHYEGTVEASDTYTFELRRTGEEPYISTVSPTDAVTITAPAADAMLSRQAGFDVTWSDPQSDSAREYEIGLNASGNGCNLSYRRSVSNAETLSFTMDDFLREVTDEEGEPTGETEPVCEGDTLVGELFVDSFVEGTMDTDLAGRIGSDTRTSINVTLAP